MELAKTLLRQGRFQASGNELLKVASNAATIADAPFLVQLAQRLCFSGEMEAARACLLQIDQFDAQPLSLLIAQAQLRWTLGEFATACELMDRAAVLELDAPEQFHFYAILLQINGRLERAASVLDECLIRWPAFADAIAARSHLRKQTVHANHVDLLHQQIRRLPAQDRSPQERFRRAELEHTLFKELDDLGQHDEAWQALARCNDLMSALNPYDGAGEAAVVEGLLDVCGVLHPSSCEASERVGPMPIFIVGMPRSGTTLLDRMLSSHSEVTSAGEISDLVQQLHWVADVRPGGVPAMLAVLRRIPGMDLAELGRRYLAQTQWRAQGARYYIDKLPGNIQWVPFIRKALPHARILHMVRAPMDVCFSNLRAMFGNISAYSYDMRAMAHYHGLYRKLVAHWHRNEPGTMLDVEYEQLVQDPAQTMHRVLVHCGLVGEEACLYPERNNSPAATPSSLQVREPIHRRGLDTWRPYASHLEPLRRLLP